MRATTLAFVAGLTAVSMSIVASTPDLPSCDVYQLACHYTDASREATYDINRVVIHKGEGATASGGAGWFANCASGGSAHYFFDKSNGYCYQCALEQDVAWHAGNWTTNCNSVGIEHSGWTANNDTSTACYDESALETKSCIIYYAVPYSRSYIIGHSQVPGCPNPGGGGTSCHTDPGQWWNWTYYMAKCNPNSTINPPYYFDADAQGFTPGNGSSSVWWAGGDWPGVAYADQLGADMFWYGPGTNYTGAGDTSFNVQLFPQNGSSGSHDLQLFWKTNAENFWDAAKSTQCVSYNRQNAWISINLAAFNAKYSGQTINQLRLDFDNNSVGTRFIVNHVFSQVTPRWWFGSSASGWTLGNGLTGLAWTNSGWPGIIYADQVGDDAFFLSPGISNFLGGENDKVSVRVYPQSGGSGTHDAKLYWATAAEPYFSEAKSSPVVNFTGNNQWYDLTFQVGQCGGWAGNWVTQLRFDVDAINHSNRWIIDYIAPGHN